MKLGTVVWTKETDLGIYLYPHSRPVQSDTLCSVLCKGNELIYHIPYNAIKSYRNQCWNCHSLVNSDNNATCSICHWVKCPVCDTCRRPSCSPDSLQILDESDPSNWEEVIGFNMDTFFDFFENDKYECLEKGNLEKIESYCEALIQNQLHALLVINSIGIVAIYVEIDNLPKAKEIIGLIDNSMEDEDNID
ncbi:MAG: hypothetical protein ACYCYE_16465 [Clostridia bacterium]